MDTRVSFNLCFARLNETLVQTVLSNELQRQTDLGLCDHLDS